MFRAVATALAIVVCLDSTPISETIDWSGYQWRVRTSNGAEQGPGPNIFADGKDNVFVDEAGNLHLRIVKDSKGRWTCAEVSTTASLGYGTYEWEVASRYDNLAKNVVGGLFTYNSPENVARQIGKKVGDAIPDTPHEIDIEFTGCWGDANLFYTTHDPDIKSPGVQFHQTLQGDFTTHRFTWSPDRIEWESYNGHVAGLSAPENPITEDRDIAERGKEAKYTYTGPVVPQDLDEKVHLNLWIFDESDKPKAPSDNQPQELILRSFRFTPLKVDDR